MARITSSHDAPLGIPGGPTIRPGASVRIDQWDILKENETVKAWVAAGILSEEADDPLDHDGNGFKGGSVPKSKRASDT